MKIAFATNDRKTLAERTGRAKEFVIYAIENSEITNTEYFENKHEHRHHRHGHEEHEHGHSHKEITDMLKGIDVLYVKKVGPHMKQDLENAGINYIITDKSDISEILKQNLS